jgi:hypothetical protein
MILLACTYVLRGAGGMTSEDFKTTINIIQAALALVPPAHDYRRAGLLGTLARVFEQRFGETGSRSDLDAAVKAFDEAAKLTPSWDGKQDSFQHALAGALKKRFELTGSAQDLAAAVDVMQETVNTLPVDHPGRLERLHDLGLACRRLAEIIQSEELLNAAIQAIEESSQCVHNENSDCRAQRLNSLAVALLRRYEWKGSDSDFTAAINACEESARLIPDNNIARHRYLYITGNIYHVRFKNNKSPNDVDFAINLQLGALKISSVPHMDRAWEAKDLAEAYGDRYRLTGSVNDLDAAVEAYSESLACDLAPPSLRIHAAQKGAALAASKYPQKAYEMLSAAVFLLSRASAREFNRDERQLLLSQFPGLASEAETLCIRSGGLPEEALALLELGRGTMINAQLETRNDVTDLEEAHPELARNFKSLRELCDVQLSVGLAFPLSGEPRSAISTIANRYEVSREFDKMLKVIRGQKGFETFLSGLTLVEMQKLAESRQIIYLNASRFGSDSFIITEHGLKHVRLHNLDYKELDKNAIILANTLKSDRVATRKESNIALRRILEWL